jgi:ribosomal protein S18 acetylase RimI-like enzyme
MVDFRAVESEDDMALLDAALRQLSADLGDAHSAGLDALRTGLTGKIPAAYGLLALEGDLIGAALFGPLFSTVRGAAGVYVSDLWVTEAARGQGLGRTLLSEVAHRSGTLWQAEWMMLAVYTHTPASRRFYERLGFEAQPQATQMRLPQPAMRRLKGEDG